MSSLLLPGMAALLFSLGALWAAGCDSGSDQGLGCVANVQQACTCADGSSSFATCLANGMWTPCQCGDAVTGTGATGAGATWQPAGGTGATGGQQPLAGSGGTVPPAAGSGGTVPPVAGSGGDPQPVAGSPTDQPTAGLGPADAGSVEVPIDGGPSGDGGPGTLDAGPQPQDSGTDAQPNPNQDEVPATAYCAPVSNWDPAWSAWEEEVLALTNEVRAQGADCGVQGTFGPAAPLTMNPNLRCSARLHSMDMAQRGFFDHYNPDGADPSTRMAAAGYTGGWSGENIAMGQTSPAQVVEGWVDSDGHCANIMNPRYTEIGIGYYSEPSSGWYGGHWWTQNFGAPRF